MILKASRRTQSVPKEISFPKWKESYVNFGDYISKKITKKRRKEMNTITISRCLLPTFGLHPYILFLSL